eukprot:5847193-Prorocentrum_lima.AAC.1
MTSSLVGSEMCIRDSIWRSRGSDQTRPQESIGTKGTSGSLPGLPIMDRGCLLYTSDAADDM